VRTRVGYAGGKKQGPTYHDLGDHSESFQLDFDPTKISYEQLLALFWADHSPTQPFFCDQYKCAIFCADEVQEKLAKKTRDALQAKLGRSVTTTIQKLDRFYLAEDYHQKYLLQSQRDVARELRAIYPDMRDFTGSTAAARINAWLSGHGDKAQFAKEIGEVGLSAAAQAVLRARMAEEESKGCTAGE
jgi:peptide-methionine (S)-S-oxide reductase